MIIQEKPKTIKVLKGKAPLDLFSFAQGYQPLLNKEEIVLFMNLFSQPKIDHSLNVESYEYSRFLDNYRLDHQEAEDSLKKLEKLNLISITDVGESRIIKLEKVKPLDELMKDSNFRKALKKELTESKYLELVEITGEEIEDSEETTNELSPQSYAIFYKGVQRLLRADFTLPPEAMSIIAEHEETLPMEVLQKFTYLSAIKTDEEYTISPKHLSFLIQQELTEKTDSFNIEDHREFWRSLLSLKEETIIKRFNDLFSKNNSSTLYQLLTSKADCPEALQKWIKVSIQENNFDYPIINALLSFVMCLLGKIPLNYLIKVSNTLKNSYSPNRIGLVALAKAVITSDLKNGKNRLNITREKPPKIKSTRPRKKGLDDFVIYLS